MPEACGVVEGAKKSVLSVIGVIVFLYFYLEIEHTSSQHTSRSHGGPSLSLSVMLSRDDLISLLALLILLLFGLLTEKFVLTGP